MLKSLLALLAIASAVVVVGLAIVSFASTSTIATTTTTTATPTARETYQRHELAHVRAKLHGMRHLAYARLVRTKQLKHVLLRRPSVREAINLACTIYGNCATLWRKAGCETGGTFDPRSRNNPSADSAMGLFEFKPSTLATTPFRGFDIFSPYVSALAAGWMHQQGRGGEWVCK